jgi:hypothetical protein
MDLDETLRPSHDTSDVADDDATLVDNAIDVDNAEVTNP